MHAEYPTPVMLKDRRRPAPFRLSLALAATSALLLAVACGESEPRYTLKQVMLEMDWSDKQVQSKLKRPAEAVEELRKIRTWLDDGAWERYGGNRWNAERIAAFEKERARFVQIFDGVIRAAESGDVGAFGEAYNRMRPVCEMCHSTYRPGI